MKRNERAIDEGKVVALYNAGWSVGQIKDEMHCEPMAVCEVLHDNGLIVKIQDKKKQSALTERKKNMSKEFAKFLSEQDDEVVEAMVNVMELDIGEFIEVLRLTVGVYCNMNEDVNPAALITTLMYALLTHFMEESKSSIEDMANDIQNIMPSNMTS